MRSVINGWELSAIVTLESGIPFNVTRGSDVNSDGNNNDRVNVVGNPFLDPHRSRSDVSNAWFNTAAFAAPAASADGNLGRNVLDSPAFATWIWASSATSKSGSGWCCKRAVS